MKPQSKEQCHPHTGVRGLPKALPSPDSASSPGSRAGTGWPLELHGHGWVHLLFTARVWEGGLDLPVARLQAVHERGHRRHGHRVVLHRVPHIRGMQVLPLVGHDLGGLLTVQHREIGGHVDVHIVHGPLGQAAVGL